MGASRTNRTLSADGKPRRNWQRAFLAALKQGHTVTSACQIAKVGRTTAYAARKREPAFPAAWQEVEQEAIEVLEAEAYRRAMAGSDKLMEFLLKARRPQIYRDRMDLRHAIGIDDEVGRVKSMTREEQERYLLGNGIIDGREEQRASIDRVRADA